MVYQLAFTDAAETILLTTFEGKIERADFETWWGAWTERVIASLQQRPRVIYLVMDVRQADTTFDAVFNLFSSGRINGGDMMTSEQTMVTPLFVGAHTLARMTAQLGQQAQFGGIQYPIFQTMEDALAFIATDQQQRQQTAAPE
jgi:hypothetical protein